MKTYLVSCLIVSFCFVASVGAQDEYPIKPSDEHKILADSAGVWDAEITMWNEGPDGPTTKSKGVETTKMLGKLWVESDFEYDFMGNQTSGRGMIGWDPSKKKYVGTWTDSASPYMSFMEGDHDEAKKLTTYNMKSKDATGNDVNYKVITGQPDATHRTFELQMQVPGSADQFMKIMEIKYEKRDE